MPDGAAQLGERRSLSGVGGEVHRRLGALLRGEQEHEDIEVRTQRVAEVGARLCRFGAQHEAGQEPTDGATEQHSPDRNDHRQAAAGERRERPERRPQRGAEDRGDDDRPGVDLERATDELEVGSRLFVGE